MNQQNALLDYMEQIVTDSAALTVKNKAYVTEQQDIVKGGVKQDGLNLNVTQVCVFYMFLLLTSCKFD